MRLLASLMLTSVLFAAACQTAPPQNATTQAAYPKTQGPLDNVTNPLNQHGFDAHGVMR